MPEPLAVISQQDAERRLAQAGRLFQHRVEHRAEVAGRGVDDLQYLGSCSLLLQRLARLGDEPSVFHCDDRLRREVFEERDLFFSERAHLASIAGDHAEQRAVLSQRQ